jgi:rubrerythrin
MTLDQLDTDGALREALERVRPVSRAELLAGAAIGAGAVIAALARPLDAQATSVRDVDILNYALTLEYLQAAFYTEAERNKALGKRATAAVEVVGAVERAHVRAFRKALGAAAVKRPEFNFGGTTEAERPFLKTAVAFEDLAVAAYKGQAPRISSPAVLAVAVGIHSVEARHAAWMRHLFGIQPSPHAFDDALSRPAVERIVASTHFISSRPTTSKKGPPRYTG